MTTIGTSKSGVRKKALICGAGELGKEVVPLIQELVGKQTSEQVNEEVEKDGKKETVVKTVYKLEGEDERLKQLIDIALLASGQLKGEALAKFVKRSVELL